MTKLLGKRVFTIILTIAVILSMIPTVVWGGNAVAKNLSNNKEYSTLQAAITDATGDATIQLLQDVTESFTINSGRTCTIDLNGHTWTGTGDVLTIEQQSGITLTNGKLISNSARGIYVTYGTVTLGDNMIVKGGSTSRAIEFRESANCALSLSDTAYLIGGLKVNSSKTLADYLPSGRTFVTCSYDGTNGTATKTTEFVTAAYTSCESSSNLALVEHTHAFTNGSCSCGAAYVAQLTSGGQTTLIKELNSNVLWKSGELTLLNDAQITYKNSNDSCYTLNNTGNGQALTIDLNDHTLTGNLVVGSGVSLTMKDGTAGTSGKLNGYLKVSGGTLNVESGTYEYNTTPYNQGAITYSSGTLNISGGTFKKNSESKALRLEAINKDNVSVTGGTFEGIYVPKMDLENWYALTKETYRFQKSDGALTLPKDTQSFDDTVTVQTCALHTWETEGNGLQYRCDYCGAINPNGLPEGTVAKIGTNNYYTSLTAAITAVTNGTVTGEIVLVADTNGENVTVSSGNITINLNGKTWKNYYNGGSSGQPALTVTGGTVTVRNGSISAIQNNTVAPAVVVNGGTFNVGAGVILSGTVANMSAENKPALEVAGGNVSLAMGTVLNNGIQVTEDKTAADYLPVNAAFQHVNSNVTELIDGTSITSTFGNLTVVQAPITSVTITGTNKVNYGNSNVTLSGSYTKQGEGNVTFAWSEVENNRATAISGANASSYTPPADLAAGTHTYRLAVTKNGYSKSNDFTLTVSPANISGANITVTGEPTYDGTAQQPEIEVKMGETELSVNTDYTITSSEKTDASVGNSNYNLSIEGKGNYTGTKTAQWQIKPAELTYTVTASPKTYDGTSTADVQVSFSYGENWKHLNENDYTVTANYDSNAVGENKPITGTVTLKDTSQTAKNYTLKDENFSITGDITKGTVAAPQPVSLQITNSLAKTYSVNLPALPGLEAGREYGNKTYTASVNFGDNSGYYESGARVENGVLTLPIKANQTKNTGEIGTVTVTVKTDNYSDITLTVKVSATNKATPQLDGELTLSTREITYGNKLSNIEISGTMKDGDADVDGSLAWENPDTIPDASNAYSAGWVFTPTDQEKYEIVTGVVTVIVKKAATTGKPNYENIATSGKTLADAKLSAVDAEGKNLFSTAGAVAWKDGNDKSVEQGAEYEWIFTPTNTNYETITGKTILWAKPASGGGGGIAPAEEDVITVKDNTASETTTKTTVNETKVETVKNEQGEEISRVTATVSEKVAEKLISQAVSNKSDTVEITVKSNDGNKVDDKKQVDLEIPKAAVESIAKDTNANIVISTDNGQVALDNKTLETIAKEAEGDVVKIVVDENTVLKEEQKAAAKVIGENGKAYELKVIAGNKVVHNFDGGKVNVMLPVPEKLQGKKIAVIYIDDKGICEILSCTMETAGAREYVKFVTSHFSNFAIVEKSDAEQIIKEQNDEKINTLIKEIKLKATTSRTSKKNVRVKVSIEGSNSLIKEAKTMGYTVKYKFYRSTKKASKYADKITKNINTYINTKGKKGTKYYYKARGHGVNNLPY